MTTSILNPSEILRVYIKTITNVIEAANSPKHKLTSFF